MFIGRTVYVTFPVKRTHSNKPAQFFLEDEITLHYVSVW